MGAFKKMFTFQIGWARRGIRPTGPYKNYKFIRIGRLVVLWKYEGEQMEQEEKGFFETLDELDEILEQANEYDDIPDENRVT